LTIILLDIKIYIIHRPSWPANKGKAQLFSSSHRNGTQNQFHTLSKQAERHTIAIAQKVPQKRHSTSIKHYTLNAISGIETRRGLRSKYHSSQIYHIPPKSFRKLKNHKILIPKTATEIIMDVMQAQNSNVGASPAKKQRHMGRSYAAVVRSSFKASEKNNQAEAVFVSNASKPRSQTLETKRTIIVVKDESLGTNKKKQRISSSNNAINNENNSSNNNSCNDVHPFLRQLDQALELEVKYRGAVQPSSSNAANAVQAGTGNAIHGSTGATITSGMRDGSSHVLRCLKVWYDLPSDVFFGAVSSIDRFLAKMKAQPKHLSCIAVSAFHLGCRQYRQLQQEQQKQNMPGSGDESNLIAIPDPADIVGISQSRCSPSDLLRMQNILQAKLELNPGAGPEPPITSLSFLR